MSWTPAEANTAFPILATLGAGSVVRVQRASSTWLYRPPPTRAASAEAKLPFELVGLSAAESAKIKIYTCMQTFNNEGILQIALQNYVWGLLHVKAWGLTFCMKG